MNRLLNKNRRKDDSAAIEGTPTRNTPTPDPGQQTVRKRWGRKKAEPEVKPELDVSVALPPTDNFRTSLIMPNLSARFSMLREQDDPSSLLGKASDDSVLTSKRRSRLADFTGTGLHDIAEVSSIRSVPRPPFAAESRTHSYQTDECGTDDESSYNGSIMSRARPGEGNTLFGGRQKIYKIPIGDAGSVKNLGSNESRGMRGRALYEDDVHMSAFQRMKERERLAERERRLAELEREMQLDETTGPMTNSPIMSTYDEKRETTSSTNSGPSIMSGSTTATSIASQGQHSTPGVSPSFAPSQGIGLQRNGSRRLYEQGLDQHLSDHQNAAMSRINSMQRKGSVNGQARLQHSRSAGNLHEPFEKGSSYSSRAASPLPPSAEKLTTFDSIREAQSQPSNSTGFMPHRLDTENPLSQALQPNDRGKATALGSFNRPKQYDEAQFLARQRSLQQQRSDSRTRRPAASPHKTDSRRPSGEGRYGYHPRPSFESRSRAGTNRSDFTRPSMEGSSRAGTSHSDQSFSTHSGTGNATQESANAESPTLGGLQEVDDSEPSPSMPSPPVAPLSAQGTTFLESPNPNDSSENLSPRTVASPANKFGTERCKPNDLSVQLPNPPPLIRDHPAMRDEAPPSPVVEKRKGMSPDAAPGGFVPPQALASANEGIPTIGIDGQASPDLNSAGSSQGLSTVREHLRQLSNVSSIYPDDTEEKKHSIEEFNMPIPAGYHTQNGPWDANTFTPPPQHAIPAPPKVRDAGTPAAPQGAHPPSGPLPQRPQDVRPGDAADWMRDLQMKQHGRGGSAETEHERKVFADDLRQRKQAIQENLKHKTENSPKMQSPATFSNGRGNVLDGPLKPFGMLRTRTSRENMAKQDPPNRMPRPMDAASRGMNSPMSMQDRSVSSPALRGMHNNGPSQPVGRTLHSRMPDRRVDDRDGLGPLHDYSRPRQNGFTSPPDSSRTSTSRDEPSSGRSSERLGRPRMASNASSDLQRRDFPSHFNSTRPSVESTRGRSDSNTSQNRGPPPLRMHNTAPGRPMMTPPPNASPLSTASAPFPSAKPHLQPQPLQPMAFTPAAANPLPAATLFRPAGPSSQTQAPTPSPVSLLGQTNTNLSQTPSANQSIITTQTLPPSTYTFPARTPAERPAARSRNGRSQVHKSDIGDPTLISSTSTFDTVTLAEKRAQFAREAESSPDLTIGVNAANTSPSSAPTSPPLSTPPVPTMNPTRRGFFHRGSKPEAGSRSGSAASGHYNGSHSGGPGSPDEPQQSNQGHGHGHSHGFPGLRKNGSQEEDDFVTRPSGGRLRIRKVSSDLGARRRHETVTAGLVEGADGDQDRNGMTMM